METDSRKLPMGYQWPGSKLTREDMIKLTELRNRTGRTITKLLHEAVTASYDLMQLPSVESTTPAISDVNDRDDQRRGNGVALVSRREIAHVMDEGDSDRIDPLAGAGEHKP